MAPRIHIAVDEDDTEWRISVRDNGEGIDAKDFERVFQLFQRLCTENERPGTGIGLSLCKRASLTRTAVRLVWNRKRVKGVCFLFTLPKQVVGE